MAHYAIAECVTDVKFIKKNKWIKIVNFKFGNEMWKVKGSK